MSHSLVLSPKDLKGSSAIINKKLDELPEHATLTYTDSSGAIFMNISEPENKVLLAGFAMKFPKQYHFHKTGFMKP